MTEEIRRNLERLNTFDRLKIAAISRALHRKFLYHVPITEVVYLVFKIILLLVRPQFVSFKCTVTDIEKFSTGLLIIVDLGTNSVHDLCQTCSRKSATG